MICSGEGGVVCLLAWPGGGGWVDRLTFLPSFLPPPNASFPSLSPSFPRCIERKSGGEDGGGPGQTVLPTGPKRSRGHQRVKARQDKPIITSWVEKEMPLLRHVIFFKNVALPFFGPRLLHSSPPPPASKQTCGHGKREKNREREREGGGTNAFFLSPPPFPPLPPSLA